MSIFANIILFLSSLLLLIDIAPSDFSSSHIKQKEAIALLEKHQNIFDDQSAKIDFGNQRHIVDPQSFQTLKQFINDNSPLAKNIKWERVVGVGYSSIAIPVGNNKLEAFRPIYVAVLPADNKTIMELSPVGEMLDLNKWIISQHQRSLISTAIILLMVGFFIQLILSILEKTDKGKNNNQSAPLITNISLEPEAAPNIKANPDTQKDINTKE